MASELWVYAEHYAGIWHDASLEVIGEARALADKAGATLAVLVLGEEHPPLGVLGSWGVDKVYTAIDARLARYNLDAYAAVLAAALRAQPPWMILAAATPRGDELCAVVAARLATALVPDCVGIDLVSDVLPQMVRPAYGGRLHVRVACPTVRPLLITLRSQGDVSRPPGVPRVPATAALTLDVGWDVRRLETIGYLKADLATVDLAEADIIVAGGRGVGSGEGFAALRQLATVLGGVVGGSRGAVDEGWLPRARLIGQSGKTIAPRLYVACGISGTIYHTAGIRDSRLIVAVNTDRHAPIFRLADIGIVGDLRQIVPALSRAVLEAKRDAPAGSPVDLVHEALESYRSQGGPVG